MAAVLRMKLADLLAVLSFSEPANKPRERPISRNERGAVPTVQHQKPTGPRQLIDEASTRPYSVGVR